jgi:hypothetical protein
VDNTLAIPEGLSEQGRKAAQVVLDVLIRNRRVYTGGCRTFYTPEEWRARGETWGLNALVIVVHDGGDVAPFFNSAYGDGYATKDMREALQAAGFYAENSTSWYSDIYPIRNEREG